MKCPRCNAQIVENASFCGVCGNAFSAPQGNGPEIGPSIYSAGNNEATMMAMPRPGEQPGPLQAPQAAFWQQAPQASGPRVAINQPQPGIDQGIFNRNGVALPPPARRRRRAGRIWARLFLVLLLLLAILVGAWFLGVRPYLHNLVLQELDQALNPPESQVLLAMLILPAGKQTIHGAESSMNTYLSSHNNSQVQNLHMTIVPGNMSLSFTSYGQDCIISALPIVSNGQIQVTNVQVQGVLGLIMSNDELASALNDNLQSFSSQMTHKITRITLLEHAIDVQFG